MKYSDTVVILAAGRGSRMGGNVPKVMQMVAGRPLLKHVIEFWQFQGVTQFVIVVGYERDIIINYMCQIDPDSWTYIIQPEQKGIADAILKTELIVPERFIVALGDCLNLGEFVYPDSMERGYGIWDNSYKDTQMRGCNVVVVKDEVVSVFEKPPMDYAGIGTYFFDRRVFQYIQTTKPSDFRGEVEIADVMTNMVRDGQSIKAVPFQGEFINCTYPRDIEAAEKILNFKPIIDLPSVKPFFTQVLQLTEKYNRPFKVSDIADKLQTNKQKVLRALYAHPRLFMRLPNGYWAYKSISEAE